MPQDDGKWLHVKETTEIGEGKMCVRSTCDLLLRMPQWLPLSKPHHLLAISDPCRGKQQHFPCLRLLVSLFNMAEY